jgi:hypothetical protein
MISKLKGIDIAFYIFLLTGFGYLITFLYGWGYNNYFSIPIAFIELSVPTVTRSIALLGLFFITISIYVTFWEDTTSLKNLFSKIFSTKFLSYRKINILLQTLCIVGLITFVEIWIASEEATKINYIGLALLFLLGLCYLKKYEKLFVLSWLILVLILPYMLGVTQANQQNKFYIIDNDTSYLVIDFYNDKAVSAKFDKTKQKIYPEFKLISIDSLAKNKKELKLVKVENLKVDQPKNLK